MGTRINYELIGEQGKAPSVVLFSKSRHEKEDPEALFRALVQKCSGPRQLTEALLEQRYAADFDGHKAGDPIFHIDFYPEDRERILVASFPMGGDGAIVTTVAD